MVAVNLWFFDHPEKSGIFNLGTGRAQPFNDVAARWCRRLGGAAHTAASAAQQGLLEYIPFPDALRGKYQCYTQADLTALRERRLRTRVRRCAVRGGAVHGGAVEIGGLSQRRAAASVVGFPLPKEIRCSRRFWPSSPC